MDAKSIARLNKIIDETYTKKIPVKYIKEFIVYDRFDVPYTMNKEEFQSYLNNLYKSGDTESLDLNYSYVLNYEKLRRDIIFLSEKIEG